MDTILAPAEHIVLTVAFLCHYERHYLLRILGTLSLNPMQSAAGLGTDTGCNLHRMDSSSCTMFVIVKYSKNRQNIYLLSAKQSQTLFYDVHLHGQIIVKSPSLSHVNTDVLSVFIFTADSSFTECR